MSRDWDQRYAIGDYLFGTEPSAFLVSIADYLKPGMRALSIGDGEGRNSVWLAKQGLHVTAIEQSSVAQAKARQLAQQQQVEIEFICEDILRWQWPNTPFDLMTLIFVHLPPAERDRLHQLMLESLAPGGFLLLEAFHKQMVTHASGPSNEDMLYDLDLTESAFAALDILINRENETEIFVAGEATKTGIAVQFLARSRA